MYSGDDIRITRMGGTLSENEDPNRKARGPFLSLRNTQRACLEKWLGSEIAPIATSLQKSDRQRLAYIQGQGVAVEPNSYGPISGPEPKGLGAPSKSSGGMP
jgi:hypothetical protein